MTATIAFTDMALLAKECRTPGAVKTFVQGLLISAMPAIERRSDHRHAICMPVEVKPCDETGKSAGPAFMAVTKDVSHGGMSLLTTVASNDQFLLVRYPQPSHSRQRVLLRVLRRREVGPLWEIAGKFVTE